jgi:hypothetical protein
MTLEIVLTDNSTNQESAGMAAKWSDPLSLMNFLRLPLFVIKHIWVSIFPAELPPARE